MFPELDIVVKMLHDGGTILYPTDTIWGIGCDCMNQEAVQKVYSIKKRPDSKSLILLVDGIEMLKRFLPDIANKVVRLHEHFTRPITIIYPEVLGLPDFLKAEDGSVAIRIAQDPFCQAVIAAFGNPIVSTSANTSGQPSPKNYKTVELTVKRQVNYIVKHRQKDNTESEPSILARYNDEVDEMEVLRA